MNLYQLIKLLNSYPANASVCVVEPDEFDGADNYCTIEEVTYNKELNIVVVDK